MPNWCSNDLLVEGPLLDVAKFRSAAVATEDDGIDGSGLSLERLYPIPPPPADWVETGGNPWWYHWCIDTWGTKWDVEAQVVGESDTFVQYTFDSAWAPPIGALDHIAGNYPTLTFTLEYDEPGMDFAGNVHWSGGNQIGHEEFNSPMAAQIATELEEENEILMAQQPAPPTETGRNCRMP